MTKIELTDKEIQILRESLDTLSNIQSDIIDYSVLYDKLKSNHKEPNYRKAFLLLMMYYDSIADEEKPFVDKELKKLGL